MLSGYLHYPDGPQSRIRKMDRCTRGKPVYADRLKIPTDWTCFEYPKMRSEKVRDFGHSRLHDSRREYVCPDSFMQRMKISHCSHSLASVVMSRRCPGRLVNVCRPYQERLPKHRDYSHLKKASSSTSSKPIWSPTAPCRATGNPNSQTSSPRRNSLKSIPS
jgi:hypothetical protein